MATKRLLYWGSGSLPSWKAMIVLEEKGLEYISKLISFDDNGHKGPELMALNPRGQVPTLKDGDTIVCESTGICLYLESTYKSQGNILMPKVAEERAKVLQKGFEATENLMPKLMDNLLYYFMETTEDERDPTVVKEKEDKCREELQIWDKYLGECGYQFVAGNDFTMADVFFFPFVAWTWRTSLDFTKFPNIKAYFDRLKNRPSIKKTWPPHWNEGEPQPGKVAWLKNM